MDVPVNGLTQVTMKLRCFRNTRVPPTSGEEPWPILKPGPPTGSSEETPSVSPAVWAKEEPAKIRDPHIPGPPRSRDRSHTLRISLP